MNSTNYMMTHKLNWLNLNFENREDEKKFRKAYFEKSLVIFRISFVTVSLLYLSYGFLDSIVAQEYLHEFLFIRFALVFPLLAIVFILSFFGLFEKIWQWLLVLCFIVGGTGIIYMLVKIPDNLFYYGGLFLILLAGFFFIRLRFFAATISSILLMMIYISFLNIFGPEHATESNYLLLSIPFYFTTIIIGVAASYNIERLERHEFSQKENLKNKQLEIESINANLEQTIKARTRELNDAKVKAEESNKIKSEFLAQMSHEIRSPINTILNFTSLLESDFNKNEDDEVQESFEVIRSAGSRITRTIDLILNMSEIQTGTYDYRPKKIDLINDVLQKLLNEFIKLAELKGIKFSFNFSSDYAYTFADEYSITQIFANLIDNAIKYTREGSINVNLFSDDSKIIVEVRDTGVGISKEYLPGLFEPFTQETQGYTRNYDGNGLGLALVKKYCDINNASIKVESEKGVGSTFRVILN
jgi:signal transduction histidine kinase